MLSLRVSSAAMLWSLCLDLQCSSSHVQITLTPRDYRGLVMSNSPVLSTNDQIHIIHYMVNIVKPIFKAAASDGLLCFVLYSIHRAHTYLMTPLNEWPCADLRTLLWLIFNYALMICASFSGWASHVPQDGLRLRQSQRWPLLLPRVWPSTEQPVSAPERPAHLQQRRHVGGELPAVPVSGRFGFDCEHAFKSQSQSQNINLRNLVKASIESP